MVVIIWALRRGTLNRGTMSPMFADTIELPCLASCASRTQHLGILPEAQVRAKITRLIDGRSHKASFGPAFRPSRLIITSFGIILLTLVCMICTSGGWFSDYTSMLSCGRPTRTCLWARTMPAGCLRGSRDPKWLTEYPFFAFVPLIKISYTGTALPDPSIRRLRFHGPTVFVRLPRRVASISSHTRIRGYAMDLIW
jgi:hypothetical protein